MKRGYIATVLGDIAPETLGHTQSHEHIFIERGKSAEISEALCIDDYEKSVEELGQYQEAGGAAIVDAQPVMAGRMASWLAAASRQSGVQIIASTGFHKTIFYDPGGYLFCAHRAEIAQLYCSEIRQGMLDSEKNGFGRTDIPAGLIKTAVEREGVFADSIYETLFLAAADAAVKTGAPVMCHMEAGANPAQVADFFLDRGVLPQQLILAHLDRALYDPQVHVQMLRRGIYLEYDTIAREKYHSDSQEVRLINEMVEQGYAGQLLLGLDTTRARLRAYGAQRGLDYILTSFVPLLLESGVGEQAVQQMVVENPRQALTFV